MRKVTFLATLIASATFIACGSSSESKPTEVRGTGAIASGGGDSSSTPGSTGGKGTAGGSLSNAMGGNSSTGSNAVVGGNTSAGGNSIVGAGSSAGGSATAGGTNAKGTAGQGIGGTSGTSTGVGGTGQGGIGGTSGTSIGVGGTGQGTTLMQSTAADRTPPTVSGVLPSGNQTGVPVTMSVTADFSEVLIASSVTTSTFSVSGVSGTVSSTNNHVTFVPSGSLAPSTSYTVTLKGGTDGIKDLSGNALVADYVWHFTTAAVVAAGAPSILYTDIVSGPTSGGENDKGIYLSVFGKNFGSSGLGTTIKVYVNDVEVNNYKYLGPSRGRQDIQQITVQVGALGNPTLGTPLPIKVTVGALVAANPNNLTFTVNPGNIYFVDGATGVDTATTTTGGTFAAPFKTLQKPGYDLAFSIQPASESGAYGRVRAGDFIVMRGGTYTDIGFTAASPAGEGYAMQTLNKSGCPIGVNCAQGGGASSGPITVMGYPGETAFIDRTNTLGDDKTGGGITSADNNRQELGMGAWWNIVDLKIESGFNDGAINTQMAVSNPSGSHWRVVNNELTGISCQRSTKCRGGAIAGSGEGNFWVGNYGHSIYDTPDVDTDLENHGIYIGDGGSYEIAYNVLANIVGGNGIQIHSMGEPVDNVSIHHNIIRDIGKHGINLADGSRDNIVIWNNIVYNTAYSGVRMGGGEDLIHGLKLYNNTFYNTGMSGDAPSSGSLSNDMTTYSGQMDIQNNIFVPHAGSAYARGSMNSDFAGGVGIFSNNLWFGGIEQPPAALLPGAVQSDPQFVDAGAADFHLQTASKAINAGSSAVSAVVIDDFDTATAKRTPTLRPVGSLYDIGAYEFSP